MITIDDEARNYFKDKVKEKLNLRIFFGGYG